MFKMKFLSWTVCGLGGIEKRSMKECICKYNPNMVILQETKKERIVPQLIQSAGGGDLLSWIDIPIIGAAGVLLLAWNPSVVRKVDED